MNLVRRIACSLARPVFGGVGAIFALHRIVRESERSSFAENRALELTAADFREMLAWLRGCGLEPVRMDEVPDRLARPRGAKFVAFTADDGYRDNLTLAAPVFREAGVPWTINITPGFINGTASVWWYRIEAALAGHPLRFEWGGRTHEFAPDTERARDAAFTELARMIRAEGTDGRDELIERICEAAGLDAMGRNGELILTWKELRELAADPLVTIGCHTHSHPVLCRLDEKDVRHEMLASRDEIERVTGKKVRHLAYPFGGASAVGAREFAIARECDFVTAVTTRSANLFPAHARHLQALPRVGMSGNYAVSERLPLVESGLLAAREWRRRVVVE